MARKKQTKRKTTRKKKRMKMKRKTEAKMKRSLTCHHPGHQNSLLIEKNSLIVAKMEKRLSFTRNAKLISTQSARL